jgi:Ca2+-binding EF-hand superfamily protein
MKYLIPLTALALWLHSVPASAQQSQAPEAGPTAAECQAMFKTADLNNDGVLSKEELASSEDLKDFYAAGENVTNVPLGKFVTDCSG